MLLNRKTKWIKLHTCANLAVGPTIAYTLTDENQLSE